MKFGRVLKEVLWLLMTEHSVSYRPIQSDFDLDQDALEAVRREFVQVKCWGVDRDGDYLEWLGATASLSGDGFVYEDLGEHELKGVSEPFQTWAVLGRQDDNANQADWDHTDTAMAGPVLVGRTITTGTN